MGYEVYLIAITNTNTNTNTRKVNIADIPNKIGFENIQAVKEISISEAQYMHGISIGKYEDTIFIISSELVFQFYTNTPPELERKLIEAFPDSDIGILTINQTTDFYGYNLISKGKRLRVRFGADTEIEIDYGKKLPEELDIPKDPLFGLYIEELKQFMLSDKDFTEKQMQAEIEHELGIRAFFKLTKRYFGKAIDDSGSLYTKIKVTHFK